MSKNYIGAKWKRTNTPVLNRQRAVSYRHRPYKAFRPTVLNEITAEESGITAEDILLTEETSEAEEFVEEVKAEAAEESTEETAEEKVQEAEETASAAETAAEAAAAAASVGFMAKATSFFRNLFKGKKAEEAVTEAAETIPAEEEIPAVAEEAAEETAEEIQEPAEEAVQEAVTEESAEEVQETVSEAEETAETEGEEPAAEEVSETEETEAASETETAEEPAEAEQAEEISAEEQAKEVLKENTDEPAEAETEEVSEAAESEEPSEVQTVIFPADPEMEDSKEDAEEGVTEVIETPAEEETETAVPAEETVNEEPVSEPEEETEEAPLTKAEKKQLKKEIRKETQTQLYDEIIDRPKTGLFTMLLMPGKAMKGSGSVKKTTMNAMSSLILLTLKWAAIGTFFAIILEKFVNYFDFSFIRMIFSEVAGLAFRFGIFGLIAEYVSYIIIGLFCGLIRRKISTFKLIEVESRSALTVTVLFVLACVLLWLNHWPYAVMAAAGGAMLGFIAKGYGMDLVLPISKTTQMILCVLLTAGAAMVSFYYFPMAVSGLTDIFRVILHL